MPWILWVLVVMVVWVALSFVFAVFWMLLHKGDGPDEE